MSYLLHGTSTLKEHEGISDDFFQEEQGFHSNQQLVP